MFRHGLYARADALVPAESGGYVLQETKASTFPPGNDKITSGRPEAHHLEDLAIQAWTYQATGWPLAGAELNLLNSRWRYPGNLDYSGLFRQLPVTSEILALMEKVPAWLAQAQKVLAGDMPAAHTGTHCTKPHPCPFHKFCSVLDGPSPAHPLELLPGLAGKRLAKTLRKLHGYTSILEPQPAELCGAESGLYRRMQIAHRTERPVLEPTSAQPFAALPYPRYYFDFEGIDLPVPCWVGVRPYEQIPFQWSCHIERTAGFFEHVEFLDTSGNDPSVPCIERMIETIPPGEAGPVFVYHRTYEEGRLRELAARHLQYATPISRYMSRLVDLLPIVEEHYYHPNMRGSFSIKAVLPTIAPDLHYNTLSEVTDGTAAQAAYLHAAFDPQTTPERRAELRKQLLIYCKQDTWAMIEVAHFLQRRGRPSRDMLS